MRSWSLPAPTLCLHVETLSVSHETLALLSLTLPISSLLGFSGLPEARTDAAMSELVPEPRPKPAVPMKPVSINSNLLGYIGIDTIIEQMRKKTMKTGFDFNVMVVGMESHGVTEGLVVGSAQDPISFPRVAWLL